MAGDAVAFTAAAVLALIVVALVVACGGLAILYWRCADAELSRRWEQRRDDMLEERRERRRKMGLPPLDDTELRG